LSLERLRTATAASLWNRLEFSTVDLRQNEVDALWQIATADSEVFKVFWSQVAGNATNIRKLRARPHLLARTIGISSSPRGQDAVNGLLKGIAIASPDEVLAVAAFLSDVPFALTPDDTLSVVERLPKAIQSVTGLASLDSTFKMFNTFALQAPPERATTILDSISFKKLEFEQVERELGAKLTPEQCGVYVDRIVSAIQTGGESPDIYGLATAIRALAPG
jgi:hypothetical protein